MTEPTKLESFPIVGSHFRPPAKGLLESLPAGTELWLQPEPDNPFDGNAIKVLLHTEALSALAGITPQQAARIGLATAPFGYQWEDLLAQAEWHLGYIPRGLAAGLAPQLSGQELPGELAFAANGSPIISVAIPQRV